MPAFRHQDLTLLNPAFDSPLVDVVAELEHLRPLQLGGTTPETLVLFLTSLFDRPLRERLATDAFPQRHPQGLCRSEISGSQFVGTDEAWKLCPYGPGQFSPRGATTSHSYRGKNMKNWPSP